MTGATRDDASDTPAGRIWRCGAAARWLPRALGGAVLASGLIVVLSLESGGSSLGRWKVLLGLITAVAALWIVRAGGEIRLEIRLTERGIRIGLRGRFVELPWREIESLDFDPPFATARRWPPALVLIDRNESRFRIPAAVEDGPDLLTEILGRAADERLRAWADARRIGARMGRSPWFTVVAYLAGVALLAGALWFVGARP